jgi:hypothetical protein
MSGLVCVLIPIPTIYNGFFEGGFEVIAWHKFLSLPARPGGVGTIFWSIVTYPSESFSHCTSMWILHSLLCCLSVAFWPATLTLEVACPWVVLYTLCYLSCLRGNSMSWPLYVARRRQAPNPCAPKWWTVAMKKTLSIGPSTRGSSLIQGSNTELTYCKR